MASNNKNNGILGKYSAYLQSLIDYAKQVPIGNGDRTIGTTWTFSPSIGWNNDDRIIYYAWNVPPTLLKREQQNLSNIVNNHTMLHGFFQKIFVDQFAKYTFSKLYSKPNSRETYYLHAWGSQYKSVFDSYLLNSLYPWEYPQSVGYDVIEGKVTGVKLYSSVTPAGLQQHFPDFLRNNLNMEGINTLLTYGKSVLIIRRFDSRKHQIGWKIEINFIENAEALWKASAELFGFEKYAKFLEDGYGSSSNAFAYDIRSPGRVHKITVYRICARYS